MAVSLTVTVTLIALLVVGVVGTVGPALPAASRPPGPRAVVAYGDSFTRAWEPVVGDQPDQSWATGSDPLVRSVAARMAVDAPNVVATNRARTGAATDELATQVRQGPTDADVVLVLLGINDACAGIDPAVVQARMADGFEALAAAHPRARIVVYAAPDLGLLGNLHASDPDAQAVRAFLRWCPPFMSHPQDLAALQEGNARLLAMNRAIEAEAAARGFDFSWATYRALTEREHLSRLDYFHPSRAGEARLAEAAWSVLSGTSVDDTGHAYFALFANDAAPGR